MCALRPSHHRIRLLAVALAFVSAAPAAWSDSIDFNRDVRPILAANCFKCHGPDEDTREAGLRLDTSEGLLEDLGGYQVVQPGDAEASELMVRIQHEDPGMRMPPVDQAEALSEEEIRKLAQWIEQGATISTHWAFEPPDPESLEPLPADWLAQDSLARDPIDSVIHQRLEDRGLQPNALADRWALVRRVYLDLTGLPPTVDEAREFVDDPSPMAYAKLVDRLLADPAFGERQARIWLDLAHYADTNGYEKDRPRSIWPYREWVIEALANDLPFDQFTVWQLAGDMLPDPTLDQKTATGFLRNTMLNEEGGIDPLEFRFLAMVDRVSTIGTTWLGTTVGCAQCHTHKYDPITHTDYYQLMALVNNADEPELQIPDPSHQQELSNYQSQLEALYATARDQFPGRFAGEDAEIEPALDSEQHFQLEMNAWLEALREGLAEWWAPQPERMDSTLPTLRWQDDRSIFADGDATKRDEYAIHYQQISSDQPVTAIRLEVLPDPRLPASGPGRSYYEGRRGDFFLSELTVRVDGQPVALTRPSHSFGSLSVGSGGAAAGNVIDGQPSTGWSTSSRPGRAHHWVANFEQPIPAGTPVVVEMLFERHFAASLGRFRLSFAAADQPLAALQVPPDLQQTVRTNEELSSDTREQLVRYFVRENRYCSEVASKIESRLDARPEPTTTMVLRQRAADNPRPTYRHHRGEYLQPEEQVEGAIPEVFQGLLSDRFGSQGPENRLELARWLASTENPLVTRVTVNRLWRNLFGSGLVRTAGDFGTQSEPPVYPQVLDRLALDFAAEDWSLKRAVRRMVLTRVYRQSSHASPEQYSRDPENRLLARGPRFRLDAEMIRDAALRASGKLQRELGGPSVRPPQPAAVTELAYGSPGWEPSQGGNRYRRSLYTFAKRTAPFAAFTVFDAPTGESCVARRDRSNTPLQSLTLLNDAMYVELAATLVRDVGAEWSDDQASPERMAQAIFQRILTRPPEADELDRILQFWQQQRSDPTEAGADLDAWALVARALMNTDEAITKE